MAQFLLNPTNHLWDRLVRVYEGQLSHSDLMVGLQVPSLEAMCNVLLMRLPLFSVRGLGCILVPREG